MKVAIISDIHDHLSALHRGLEQVKGADALIVCGDLCSPFVVKALGQGFPGGIYLVLGNNDGDALLLSERASAFPQIHLYPVFADFTLAGKRIAVIHYDEVARPIIASGWYDLVCFGHNHKYEVGISGKTLFINPGELSGVLTGSSTLVLWDTETNQYERVILSN